MYQIKNELVEKALLIGPQAESLTELKMLSETAGAKIISTIAYQPRQINAAFYIGSGKAQEIKEIANNKGANLIIFDYPLSPVQQRNLENKIAKKVIDRAQVILDIFAHHAHSKESKIQVELAQLEYRLPRLQGQGNSLSRLAGGIGSKGPGESKLEVDRRRIEDRIHRLKTELTAIAEQREVQKSNRKDPLVALVGYTNAGKSTLLNKLTAANTLVADQLFATLDAKMRQLQLDKGKNQVILTDTVGFIDKLPHQLVASFRTTLAEISNAKIILHIIDSASQEKEKQIKVVEQELKKLKNKKSKVIKVFNKIDMLSKAELADLKIIYPTALFVSAEQSLNLEILKFKLTELLKPQLTKVELLLPYEQAGWIAEIHQQGEVKNEKYKQDKVYLEALLPIKIANKLKKYSRRIT
ncbi:GTPase HflX [Halanaerobium salsuginis]|uniref:GTPase HflX n=1 Tax=Halanaerobium salsuginis TaxID=29563 RepID=A0A1I4HAX8_9FIRM|nr:GTPase HflX [Halanaerobium salsuginis]SFL38581.1 GTP-binding protein HflX [Halanaerobium salsuginis]